MPLFSDSFFLSCNGATQIHVRRCAPERAPKAVVQLSHGIAEHIRRYDDFAAFLAEQGYLVVGNDHLGHGLSFTGEEDRGFFGDRGGWDLAIGDMRRLYENTRAEYPELPYFLFGHSMGSFLTRSYLIKYRNGLTGAVLSGTAQQPAAVVQAGLKMGAREVRKHGARYRSETLNNMAFGGYNRHFEPKRTVSDWISRDSAVVDRYMADPLCGFIPTAGLFRDMMGGIAFNQRASNLARMRKDLPVLFLSGDQDPVGANGRGVILAYERFLAAGMQDVTLKLYHGGRHEMLNELNRDLVYADVLGWLESKRSQAERARAKGRAEQEMAAHD